MKKNCSFPILISDRPDERTDKHKHGELEKCQNDISTGNERVDDEERRLRADLTSRENIK